MDGKPIVRFVPTTETGPDFRARVERSEDSRLGKSIDLVLGTDLRELLRKRCARKAAARKESEQQAAAGAQQP